MRIDRIADALFPIYIPSRWGSDPTRMFDYLRLPFFIVWPLRWWRDLHIQYLVGKVRRRVQR